MFIDWSAYRTTFEDYAGRALGHRVTVLGSADARLLPTPTLTFSDVRVGEAEDPLMVVSRFRVRVELPPLLTGKIQVVDMELDKPELHVSLDESGRVDWLTGGVPDSGASINPDDVQLEDVEVTSGAVRVIDARTGKTYRADNINLHLSALSLQGPFKADGSASIAGIHQSIRVATGRRDADGGIRVKANIQPTNYMASVQADGVLQQNDGKPVFAGSFVAESVQQAEEAPPADPEAPVTLEPVAKLWRGEGQFSLDPSELKFEEIAFRYGPEDRAVRLQGTGRIGLGPAPRFEADLQSKQIDLDRIFGAGPQEPVTIQDGAAAIVRTVKSLPLPAIPGSFRLDLPALVAAGGLAQDIYLEAETLPRGWNVKSLEARLPGQTLISASGELRVADEPAFSGRAGIVSSQPSAFAAWWRRGEGEAGAPLSLDAFSLSGRIEAAADGVAVNGLKGQLGDAAITGQVTWRAPSDQRRARLAADLKADRLDIDQLSVLAGTLVDQSTDNAGQGDGTAPAGTDFALTLNADTLVYAGVEAQGIQVAAGLAGDELTVERFSARDLAGAAIEANGRVAKLASAPDGQFQTTVKASRLDGLTSMLERLFPDNPGIEWLAASEDALAPVDLAASFTAKANDASTSHVQIALGGTVGGSQLDASADLSGSVETWRDAAVDARVALKAGDGVELLRQLGLDLVPVDGLGAGELTIKAQGTAASGVELTVLGRGLATSVDFDGTVAWPAGSDPVYGGRLAFESEDVTPLGMLAGRIMPMMTGEIPVSADARIDGAGTSASLKDLSARFGTTSMSGDLDLVLGDPVPRLSGTAKISRVALAPLSELLLGADAWSSTTGGQAGDQPSVWPGAALGTPLLGSGTVSLDITTDAVDVGLQRPVEQASFALQLGRDELALDDFSGSFNGGTVKGSLLLKRSGPQAVVSGNLGIEGASLENLVWRRNDRPVATGLFDAKVDFEGTGRSISGMVAGLAGGGSFTVRDGELRGINPNAFSSVIRAADAGLDLEPKEISRVFGSHLDAGSLPFNRIDGTLVIAAGTARARNVTVDSASATALGTAQVDLERWRLESDWSLKVDPGENAVTGAEAQVGILFRGPLDDPKREIDIQPFTAFLTLRAFEKEVRRVEDMQADILERDRLMRQLRQLRRDETKRQQSDEEKARAEEAAAEAARRQAAEREAAREAERARAEEERAKARERAQARRQEEERAKAAAEAQSAEPSQTEPSPTPQPQAGTSRNGAASNSSGAGSNGQLREPLSMEDFIKRIRPAIDGDQSRAPETDGRLRPAPAAATGEPMPLTGGLGGLGDPITVETLPATPLDDATGSIDRAPETVPRTTEPAAPARSQPRRTERKPEVPRYIMGPGSRVLPNPAYRGE